MSADLCLPPGVRVKPLRWMDIGDAADTCDDTYDEARGITGTYRIADGVVFLGGSKIAAFGSMSEARAWCEREHAKDVLQFFEVCPEALAEVPAAIAKAEGSAA